MIAKHLQDVALMLVPPVTGRRDPVEFPRQPVQPCDPRPGAPALTVRYVMCPIEVSAFCAMQRDQLGHIVQRQPQIAGMTDEPQPVQRAARS